MAYGDDLKQAVDQAIDAFIKGTLTKTSSLPIDWFTSVDKIRETAYNSIGWAGMVPDGDPDEPMEVRAKRFHEMLVQRAVDYTNTELTALVAVTIERPPEKYVVEPDTVLGKAIDTAVTRAADGQLDKTHRHRVNFIASVLGIRDEAYEEAMTKLSPTDHRELHVALTSMVSKTLALLDRDYILATDGYAPKGCSIGYVILPETDPGYGNVAGNLQKAFDALFDDVNN